MNKTMDFRKELEEMRENYAKRPLKDLAFPKPAWMRPEDGLYSTYTDKDMLIREGVIYYAYIVQANCALFSFFPHDDLPANIIYSTEDAVSVNPKLLQRMGRYLFHFKNEQEHADSEYKEILNVIRDEHDRSSFVFKPLCSDELGEEMHFTSIMVFRKHLPHRVLKCNIVPVIAAPNKCRGVIILPKRYWTKAFKNAWLENFTNT